MLQHARERRLDLARAAAPARPRSRLSCTISAAQHLVPFGHDRQAGAPHRIGAQAVERPCRPSRTLPCARAIAPASASTMLDLPAPLGPSSATISPAADVEVDAVHDGLAAALHMQVAHVEHAARHAPR